jgi:hypothetical protein
MHPEVNHVAYPVHVDGTKTGAPPRMRHHPDCGHLTWDGEMLGTPELASPEQMKALGACETCVGATDRGSTRQPSGRLGNLCPTCRQVMPLTAVCDNCG